jgi:threonyl-tRNA synthetase
MSHVYGVFGFEFHLKLSTRPENFIGEVAVWDSAEKVNRKKKKKTWKKRGETDVLCQ